MNKSTHSCDRITSSTNHKDDNTASPDNLIPSKTVRVILGGVSDMTIWRWLHDENYKHLDFPKPIKIATRRYWKKHKIEDFIERQEARCNSKKLQEQQCAVA